MFKLLEDAIAPMVGEKTDADNVEEHHYVNMGRRGVVARTVEARLCVNMGDKSADARIVAAHLYVNMG